ncbi:MAG TPA: hypothetical protein VGX25_21455, partial [Actinophytocola sp.]|nr:hypothetical protein [Actinophytocola sp.]
MTATIVHRGRWTRADRARDSWPRLPFELPAGCPALTVELEYDPAGGAVIDLGCAGPAGWRGWSGAARRRFVITAEAATPGYRPGELEAGAWHVVLGLHRLPADGTPFTVTISTGAAAPPDPPAEPPVPD